MKPHLATDFGRTQSRQDTFEATSKALHKKVKNVQGQGGELAKTVSELKDIRMTNKSDLGVHRNQPTKLLGSSGVPTTTLNSQRSNQNNTLVMSVSHSQMNLHQQDVLKKELMRLINR